jgi:hypothetical protein
LFVSEAAHIFLRNVVAKIDSVKFRGQGKKVEATWERRGPRFNLRPEERTRDTWA